MNGVFPSSLWIEPLWQHRSADNEPRRRLAQPTKPRFWSVASVHRTFLDWLQRCQFEIQCRYTCSSQRPTTESNDDPRMLTLTKTLFGVMLSTAWKWNEFLLCISWSQCHGSLCVAVSELPRPHYAICCRLCNTVDAGSWKQRFVPIVSCRQTLWSIAQRRRRQREGEREYLPNRVAGCQKMLKPILLATRSMQCKQNYKTHIPP